MGDLSNKTVALLVVIATIVFLVGITSVPKGGITYLTGRGTTGVTSYWVQSELTINVTQTAVAFDSGKVNTGYNNCTVNSNYTDNAVETSGSASEGCGGNWTGINTRSFVVRNDGTVNVNITIQSTKLAAGFIPTYGAASVTPEYNFKSYDSDGTGACISADLISEWTAMSNTTAKVICSNLANSEDTDELSVPIQLVIPDNVQNGTYSDTVTFAALQS